MAGLGIYHYQARFYSPKLGRFLSADTIVPDYANPQNLNRFSYVANNPLRYTDPTGHMMSDGGDGGLGVQGYTYVIEKKHGWKLKGKWSQKEVQTIYQTGNDILAYVDGVTGGNGLDWMQATFGNTTIEHGENSDGYSDAMPFFGEDFGPRIRLGQGWLNSG
ncbi:MAG: hypothetical protein M3R47_09250, partial [Chloroflexota bacterium]|nr:hypothetical protein [Chloroflexota bacterium]